MIAGDIGLTLGAVEDQGVELDARFDVELDVGGKSGAP